MRNICLFWAILCVLFWAILYDVAQQYLGKIWPVAPIRAYTVTDSFWKDSEQQLLVGKHQKKTPTAVARSFIYCQRMVYVGYGTCPQPTPQSIPPIHSLTLQFSHPRCGPPLRGPSGVAMQFDVVVLWHFIQCDTLLGGTVCFCVSLHALWHFDGVTVGTKPTLARQQLALQRKVPLGITKWNGRNMTKMMMNECAECFVA